MSRLLPPSRGDSRLGGTLDDRLYHMALHETNKATFIEALQASGSTACAASSRMTRLRARALADSDPKAQGAGLAKAMAKFFRGWQGLSAADQETLERLRRCSRRELHTLRVHKSVRFENEALDNELKNLPLLPANLAEALPNAGECRQRTEDHLRSANQNAVVVSGFLTTLRDIYHRYVKPAALLTRGWEGENVQQVGQVGKYPLAVGLIVSSGRRSAEILNGKSEFTPGSTPYSVNFKGQLKTNANPTYEIPLLVPADIFLDALAYLRVLQGNAEITNAQVNKSYSTRLNEWSGRMFTATRPLIPHDLRRLYAVAAYKAYGYDAPSPPALQQALPAPPAPPAATSLSVSVTNPAAAVAGGQPNVVAGAEPPVAVAVARPSPPVPTLPAFIEQFLGHANLQTSLHYSNVLVPDMQPILHLCAYRIPLTAPPPPSLDARKKQRTSAEAPAAAVIITEPAFSAQ